MKTVNIRNYRAEDYDALTKAAAADGHPVYAPSTVYEKDGEIVGYYSMSVPLVMTWQHTKKMGPLDSVKVLGHIEGSLRAFPFVCLPCDPESPFMRFCPNSNC